MVNRRDQDQGNGRNKGKGPGGFFNQQGQNAGSKAPSKSEPIELSVIEPTIPSDPGLVYIAYAEKDDDVAFELSTDIEEILGVYEIMKEDGYAPRLFQATEISVTETDEEDD